MSSTVVIAFCSLAIVLLSVVAVMLLVYIFCPPAFCWKRPVLNQQPIVDEVESIAGHVDRARTDAGDRLERGRSYRRRQILKLKRDGRGKKDDGPSDDERAPEIN